jgi:hypothetical protein
LHRIPDFLKMIDMEERANSCLSGLQPAAQHREPLFGDAERGNPSQIGFYAAVEQRWMKKL